MKLFFSEQAVLAIHTNITAEFFMLFYSFSSAVPLCIFPCILVLAQSIGLLRTPKKVMSLFAYMHSSSTFFLTLTSRCTTVCIYKNGMSCMLPLLRQFHSMFYSMLCFNMVDIIIMFNIYISGLQLFTLATQVHLKCWYTSRF